MEPVKKIGRISEHFSMNVYWLGSDPPSGLSEIKQVDTLEGVSENSLVFVGDKSRIKWKSISGQRVYLVSDLPISTPLPENVVGLIPRDAMVITAIAALYSEMRDCYDLEDKLIRSLNEKDLTIQEKQKNILRESKRYQSMIKNATDLIFTLGPAGKIVFSNETMKRYLRESGGSLAGRSLTDFVVEDDRDLILDLIKKGFEKGAPSKVEVKMRLTKGNTGIFSLMSTPLMDEDRIYTLSVIGRDITDIRSMQHRLSLQTKDLTLMINGLAHELRNPLTVIGAYMKRIERREKNLDPEAIHSALAGINSSVQRIEEMIHRIEKYEAMTKQKLVYREVDIRRIIADVIEELPDPLDVTIAGEGPIIAYTDANNIKAAFSRILENAIQTGSERFDINLSHRDGYAYVSLRDYGPGILDDTDAIFAPFYSTDPMRIGLGLTEARIAMAKIGSDIEIIPQANTGAIFTLKILMDRRNALRDE